MEQGFRDTWGVFTEANYEVDDVTTLTAGIRFNKADIVDAVMSGITDLTLLGGYNGALQGYPVVPEGSTALDEWTGRLILDRKLADGNLIYVKYDRGLKSGGFNPTFAQSTAGSTDSTLGLVDPEIHNVLEVGSKGRYLGGALTVNAAAYMNSVAGMQLQKIWDYHHKHLIQMLIFKVLSLKCSSFLMNSQGSHLLEPTQHQNWLDTLIMTQETHSMFLKF